MSSPSMVIRPGAGIVITWQEVRDGRFSAAGWADDANDLSRSRFEANVVKHRQVAVDPAIAERNVFESNHPTGDLDRSSPFRGP